MIHKKIRIPKDTAAEVMDELGKLEDAIQFIDLNHLDFEAKKNFGSLIKRCEDVEKKIA